jgi:hypothetical protein
MKKRALDFEEDVQVEVFRKVFRSIENVEEEA